MIQFNLRGQGNSCKVEVSPPITFFEGDTFINQEYTQKVRLQKLTQGTVKYQLRMEAKNRQSFHCAVSVQGKTLMNENDVLKGELTQDEVDISISMNSQECGKALAYFYIEIEDGPPVSFSCQADFRGPIVNLVEPVVDLGLAKVNTKQQFTLTIENQSPIEAYFCLKNAQNKKMTIDNCITHDEAESREEGGEAINNQLVCGRPISSKMGNKVMFDTSKGVIRPRQRISITLICDCLNQESIEEYFEIMIKDSKSLFFQLLGEI
jgi:hypothetical protein